MDLLWAEIIKHSRLTHLCSDRFQDQAMIDFTAVKPQAHRQIEHDIGDAAKYKHLIRKFILELDWMLIAPHKH